MKNFEQMHNIIIESREKISISGVVSVEEFDENIIFCVTNCGGLYIRGENLHVEKLDLEQHELNLVGVIECVEYDKKDHKGSFFSKLFK
ncbi:MAG: YabP/YqfC family sporulation protein [Clostridia bacterium]